MNNRFLTNDLNLNEMAEIGRKLLKKHDMETVMCKLGHSRYLNGSEMEMLKHAIIFGGE